LLKSFFPNPKLFFPSTILWTFVCGAIWFSFLSSWQGGLDFFGQFLTTTPGPDGRPPFLTPDRLLIYAFIILAGILFAAFWTVVGQTRWKFWSIWGSTIIVVMTYFSVQIDVYLNEWFGAFYDMLQQALGKTRVVPIAEYYGMIYSVTWILVVSITVLVLLSFFISHYIFRWRTAMNDYYVEHWQQLRVVEGASQRVQEDTMRFARQLEGLGVAFINSIMTLIAFFPLLWVLSSNIKEIPFFPAIDGSLVFVALISASFGTILLALVGIKLPGLEFRNQRVEAAYRKELVYGEDHADRADPLTLAELYSNVRRNYFRLYFNYLYFGVARWSYLQGATFVPYFALGPTVVSAGITLGIFQQINNAFDKVDGSFRFFASAWTDIVELLSIYKRLKAFEAVIEDEPLPTIDQKFIEAEQAGVNPDAGPEPTA
jgi:peptide/bleomycin uptake transporter